MHRFFLPHGCITGEIVSFPAKTSRQIARVLRLQPGQSVVTLDNLGWEYEVRLVNVEREMVTGTITARRQTESEPKVRIGLYLGLTQREKFEWVLQKCTEVGASEFTPVVTARSLVQAKGEVERKRQRWESILQEAAEQSGQFYIPTLRPALSFEEALTDSARFLHRLIPWEQEKANRLGGLLSGQFSNNCVDPFAALFIGPEGGFTEEEIGMAIKSGLTPVSLGSRILRMETAAIVAAALVINDAEMS